MKHSIYVYEVLLWLKIALRALALHSIFWFGYKCRKLKKRKKVIYKRESATLSSVTPSAKL